MKLTTFNNDTMPKQAADRVGLPRVRFQKGGLIVFNRTACRLMNLTAGKKIAFSQDEENPEDWYFHLDDKNGFQLREGYDKNGSTMFNHVMLLREFNKVFEFTEDESRTFIICKTPAVGKDKTKYWCLLVNKD